MKKYFIIFTLLCNACAIAPEEDVLARKNFDNTIVEIFKETAIQSKTCSTTVGNAHVTECLLKINDTIEFKMNCSYREEAPCYVYK